jgi:hypothetical protein
MTKFRKMFLGAVSAMTLAAALASPAAATCKYNCGPKPTSGYGSAYFGGVVGSQNLAGALGDLTIATTNNWKEESGGAGVSTGTDQPTTAYGFSHVSTGGSGMSGALSLGFGGSLAESMVIGELGGGVEAGFETGK